MVPGVSPFQNLCYDTLPLLVLLKKKPVVHDKRSSVAQLVERSAVNRLVAGSSPARGATFPINALWPPGRRACYFDDKFMSNGYVI